MSFAMYLQQCCINLDPMPLVNIFKLKACRGDKHDEPVTPMDVVDSFNNVEVDAGVLYTLPAGADFLMCYSVAEGQCENFCFVLPRFATFVLLCTCVDAIYIDFTVMSL